MNQIYIRTVMISIVIPAYNEENSIQSTINEISLQLEDSKYSNAEIIIVDDGSSDLTLKKAEETNSVVIRNPHNVGYGRSLKRGIEQSKFDTIVIIDADLSYPAESIPKLLDIYFDGKFDMVVGQRTGSHYRGSALKAPLRIILRFMVEFTAGRSISDINSGLRVFSKNTIMEHFPRLCDTFSFTTSMTLAYMLTGRFVAYHPIDYRERVGETKVNLFSDSLRTLQYIVEAIIYYNPLKIFLLMMLVIWVIAILFLVIAAFSGLTIAYVLGIGSIISSIIVFCFGLLAVLLKQIMQKQDIK